MLRTLDPVALLPGDVITVDWSTETDNAGQIQCHNESVYGLRIDLGPDEHYLRPGFTAVYALRNGEVRLRATAVPLGAAAPVNQLTVAVASDGDGFPAQVAVVASQTVAAVEIQPQVVTTQDNPAGSTVILLPDTTPFRVSDDILVTRFDGSNRTLETIKAVNPGVSVTISAPGGLQVDYPAGAVVSRVQTVAVLNDGSQPLTVNQGFAGGSAWPVDVSDRAGRSLGIVASIAAAVDVADRAVRLLGHVSLDSGGTLKGQALAANSVPVIRASDDAPYDVSDRAARQAGLVGQTGSWSADVAEGEALKALRALRRHSSPMKRMGVMARGR